jgi:hypothetical protein
MMPVEEIITHAIKKQSSHKLYATNITRVLLTVTLHPQCLMERISVLT